MAGLSPANHNDAIAADISRCAAIMGFRDYI